jgi:hypothetical protein
VWATLCGVVWLRVVRGSRCLVVVVGVSNRVAAVGVIRVRGCQFGSGWGSRSSGLVRACVLAGRVDLYII